jgi:DNA-binding transcriptional MerR regulator
LKALAVGGILAAYMNRYSLRELAKAANTSAYAIRHYVKGGLLHPAVRSGQSRRFDDSHLVALGVIGTLRAAGHRGRDLAARIPAEIARAKAATAAPAVPVRQPTARDAVDAAVCAAAESLDISPRGLRVALEAVLRRLHDAGISPGEAAQLVGRAGTDA